MLLAPWRPEAHQSRAENGGSTTTSDGPLDGDAPQDEHLGTEDTYPHALAPE
jgi:hypothetical protein